MVNLKLLNFRRKLDTLWQKFRCGEYGDGCGQFKDSTKKKKSNFNNFLLKFTYGCLIFLCISAMLMIPNYQTFWIGLYFAGVFAFLTALSLAAIILSLSRVGDETNYQKLQESRKITNGYKSRYIFNLRHDGKTMEEFSRLLAEKLTLLQNTRKDS